MIPAGVLADAPHLYNANPGMASNTENKVVTIVLTGSGFVPQTKAAIYSCYMTPQFSSVSYISPTQISITYNFYGATTDKNWHIKLQNPEGPSEVIPFVVYGSSSPGTTTTTTTTETTAVSMTTTPSGKNSIFFETNPTGATIYVDGNEAGSSAFKYYTDNDGTFNVVAKKIGYEDYEGKVTVVDGGPTARFYALLTPLASTGTAATTAVTSSASPVKTITGIQNTTTTTRKSTLKIPTPLGTDPPLTAEESPADPAIALIAGGLAIMFAVIRRR
jgi:hypothetical protein